MRFQNNKTHLSTPSGVTVSLNKRDIPLVVDRGRWHSFPISDFIHSIKILMQLYTGGATCRICMTSSSVINDMYMSKVTGKCQNGTHVGFTAAEQGRDESNETVENFWVNRPEISRTFRVKSDHLYDPTKIVRIQKYLPWSVFKFRIRFLAGKFFFLRLTWKKLRYYDDLQRCRILTLWSLIILMEVSTIRKMDSMLMTSPLMIVPIRVRSSITTFNPRLYCTEIFSEISQFLRICLIFERKFILNFCYQISLNNRSKLMFWRSTIV